MKFESFQAGVLRQRYQYKSFEPVPVNHEWVWEDATINALLEAANRALGELNAFSLIVPDIDLFIEMHVVKEAQTSSRIEGTQTGFDEALMSEEQIQPEKRDDWREVRNYIDAVNTAIAELKTLPLSNRLLKQTHDPKKRKALLASKVEDMINTVVRQIAFYTFERKVHTARKEGELTPDQINEIWMSIQEESLGDGIAFGPGYETFWTYIPHFIHSPFYVYAYAFGDCLVNSLYARYRESAAGFQDKYFEMLKAGGTKHHSELLKPFGLDATDHPSPTWDGVASTRCGGPAFLVCNHACLLRCSCTKAD